MSPKTVLWITDMERTRQLTVRSVAVLRLAFSWLLQMIVSTKVPTRIERRVALLWRARGLVAGEETVRRVLRVRNVQDGQAVVVVWQKREL